MWGEGETEGGGVETIRKFCCSQFLNTPFPDPIGIGVWTTNDVAVIWKSNCAELFYVYVYVYIYVYFYFFFYFNF